MPELPNLKHEKFARAVLANPSFASAYKQTYGVENPRTAENSASRLMGNDGVRNRVIELMNQKGLGLAPITERLGKWVYDDEHPAVSMDAIKTGLKLHGVLEREESGANMGNVQINIVNLSEQVNT